jgi:DNA mismatch repair protein MSH6
MMIFRYSINFPFMAVRKSRSNSSAIGDDDDEFIVPSDSDTEVKSVSSHGRSSSRSSNRSSRRSGDDEFTELGSDFDDDDMAIKSKATSKAKKSASAKKSSTKGAAGSATLVDTSFLTAAEKRAQGKKNEKQTTDEAFAFLKDLRDVSSRHYLGFL